MDQNKPIHLLSLSLDTNLLTHKMGDALSRQQEYARHFAHTSLIVMNHGTKFNPVSFDNLDIYPVNGWSPFDALIRAYFLAQKIYKRKPYQLITAQDPIGVGRVGKWLKQKYHLPLNIQLHTDYFGKSWVSQRLIHRWYLKQIIKVLAYADSIRVVSTSIKKSVTQALSTKDYKPNIFVAPIRVDLSLFWKPARYRPKISKFIFVGRLAPEKNLPKLLESFQEVLKKHSEATLTIVGDGPERKNLESRISNLASHINLVGAKKPEEVAALLQAHDIFVMTSLYEGFSLAQIEAFAAGLPIITSPVAAVGELLHPDQNCLVASNVVDFASSMSHLISHPEEAYRLAKNGQMWVKQNLDSKVLTNVWINGLYQTINGLENKC